MARLPRHSLRVLIVGAILGTALVLIVSSSSASKSPTTTIPVSASLFHDVYYEDLVQSTRTAYPFGDVYMSTVTAPPSPEPTTKPTVKPTTKPTVKPTPKPAAKPVIRSESRVSGVATWYCWPNGNPPSRCTLGFSAGGAYGAAGPELRAALGNWRGKVVYVNGVRVKLIDWCACGGNHVVDVYHSTWIKIPHPSNVTIRW